MKILVPIEVPDGSYDLLISATATSPEETRQVELIFNESEIGRFYRFMKLFEDSVVKYGLI